MEGRKEKGELENYDAVTAMKRAEKEKEWAVNTEKNIDQLKKMAEKEKKAVLKYLKEQDLSCLSPGSKDWKNACL